MLIYGQSGPWKLFNEIFNLMPMGALIDNKIYWIHDGLSPSIKLADRLSLFERPVEILASVPLSDIVLCDPEDID